MITVPFAKIPTTDKKKYGNKKKLSSDNVLLKKHKNMNINIPPIVIVMDCKGISTRPVLRLKENSDGVKPTIKRINSSSINFKFTFL